MNVPWYRAPGTPSHMKLWWAVEHLGHPAFYLRALMPGDFGPAGRGPLPRHTYDLIGRQLESYPVGCETCFHVPQSTDLVPIERATDDRGRDLFFAAYVFGQRPWPEPTSLNTCWECSDPREPAVTEVDGRRLCLRCGARSLGVMS